MIYGEEASFLFPELTTVLGEQWPSGLSRRVGRRGFLQGFAVRGAPRSSRLVRGATGEELEAPEPI